LNEILSWKNDEDDDGVDECRWVLREKRSFFFFLKWKNGKK